MPGPWEKYQRQQPASGPWSKYQKARQETPASSETGYGQQMFSGLLEGATAALGAPVDAMNNFVVAPALKGVNAVFGTDFQPSAEPLGGSAGLRRGLSIVPQSDSRGEQFARRVAQSVGGASVPLAGSANSLGQVAAGLAAAAGGGVGGATAQQLFPGNAGAEMAGELIGGLGTGAAISGLANRAAQRAAESTVPSVEQLKSQASDLYKLAENQGVTASQKQTQMLARDFRAIATHQGLISPTGRVSEAYPRAAEAMRMMDDYASGTMSPTQMQTVRDVLSDAVSSTQGKEQRIARIMLDRFDNFTAPLAPPLAQARSLYSRAAKADQLETLRELAASRAGQYSGSGYENALRTEYRGLERKIIKGQERGWSPEQQRAISRVAQGTPTSNTFRNVGRLAPTGVVSFGLGGGVPFTIGNAIGGPALGGILSGASMGGGFLARDLATRLGVGYADAAELLARSGGIMPQGGHSPVTKSILEGLLGAQAARQGN